VGGEESEAERLLSSAIGEIEQARAAVREAGLKLGRPIADPDAGDVPVDPVAWELGGNLAMHGRITDAARAVADLQALVEANLGLL